MAWQDAFSPATPGLDPDQEREARLIAQARSGADWALSALIARYQPPVIRYLTRLTGNPALARSMSEGIFLRMERRLHGPQGGRQLRLWLLRACTDSGLESLRHPRRKSPARLAAPARQTRLLAERAGGQPVRRFMKGLGRLAEATSSTRRQVRQLIWTDTEAADESGAHHRQDANGAAGRHELNPLDDELDALDPREALRHRLVRAVLAELPYGDAQCLALHLVAGLNQAEVAQALGITPSAARKHVVIGLQMFASRYEAALANLGVPRDLGYHLTSPQVVQPVYPTAEPEPLPRPTMPPAAAASAANGTNGASGSGNYRVTPPIVPLHTLQTEHAAEVAAAAARQERLDMAGDDDEATLAEVAALHVTGDEAVAAAEPRADMVVRLAENAIIGPVVDALPLSPDVSMPGKPTMPSPTTSEVMRGPTSRQLSYDLASAQEAPDQQRQGERGETLHPADRSYAGVPLHFDLQSASSQRLTAGPAPASQPLPVSALSFEALTQQSDAAPAVSEQDRAWATSPTGETPVVAHPPEGAGATAPLTPSQTPVQPRQPDAQPVPALNLAPLAGAAESAAFFVAHIPVRTPKARAVPVRTPHQRDEDAAQGVNGVSPTATQATMPATSSTPSSTPSPTIDLVTEITLEDIWTHSPDGLEASASPDMEASAEAAD